MNNFQFPMPVELDKNRLSETAHRMSSAETSFTIFTHDHLRTAEVYVLDENGKGVAEAIGATSISSSVDHLQALLEEVNPRSKLPDDKAAVQVVQKLERGLKTRDAAENVRNLQRLALFGAIAKPDDIPPHLAPEKILGFKTPLRKQPKETQLEKVYRCAVFALRNRATAPFSDPQLEDFDQGLAAAPDHTMRYDLFTIELGNKLRAPLAVAHYNQKLLKALARKFLGRLVDPSLTRQQVIEEAALAVHLSSLGKKNKEQPQETTVDPEPSIALPVQYVDWEPVPPSSLTDLGITLPAHAQTDRKHSDPELVKLHPRDQERFKLLAEIAIACCGDWEWGDEHGQVRIVRGRIRGGGGGEGTRRRLNRYRIAILPKHRDDGSIAEDAVAIGRYGNAALVWSDEAGWADGKQQREWPEVFKNSKKDIVAMGATWIKHSPTIRERIIATLMQHRTVPSSDQ